MTEWCNRWKCQQKKIQIFKWAIRWNVRPKQLPFFVPKDFQGTRVTTILCKDMPILNIVWAAAEMIFDEVIPVLDSKTRR